MYLVAAQIFFMFHLNYTAMNWEYKILRGTDVDVLKTLNQWKHEFNIKVHTCNVCAEGTHMFLARRKK